ncbi:MAG: signal peptidase II [Akkermansia sp.]
MRRGFLLLALLIALLVLVDQVSKWLIVLNFPFAWELGYSPRVLPLLTDNPLLHFSLVRVHNTGVAFGTGNGTVWAPYLFLGVQVAALVVFSLFYRRGYFAGRVLKLAWALIMAGILGNMADRLVQGFFRPGAEALSFWQNLSRGYVVDFLDFSFPWIRTEMWPMGYHWPSFNVADSCVCTAAALFLLVSLFSPRCCKEGRGA